MTHSPPQTTGRLSHPSLSGWLFALALALLSAVSLRADAPATALRITSTGRDTEALPTFRLDWNASSNATYLVQSTTSLASGAPWSTLDSVRPPDQVGSYQLAVTAVDSTGSVRPPTTFYRLILPQPQIFSVEPAIVAPGVAVDFYVIGQCFPTNAVLRIKNVPMSGTLYQSSTTLVQPSFVPDVPGDYQFSLVVSGQVVSAFTVVCADPLANPELVLQGPPGPPPARPTFMLRSASEKAQILYAEEGIEEMSAGPGGDVHIFPGAPDKCGDGMIQAVTLHSGEVSQQVVDLAIPGRELDFIWARTYNSRIGRSTAPNGWTFSYDIRCVQNGSGMDVYDGTGRKDTFKLGTNGVYTCPEFFREGTLSNNIFTLTFADTGRWVFNPFDGTASAGKGRQIITRNGSTMTLGYDTSGRLAQIVDDLGRTNTVGYDSSGRIASVTDFSGRTVRYEYDTNGDLVSVISPPVTGTPNGNDFPGGKTNRFTYSSGFANPAENHLLLSVIDASGQTIYRHVYQHNQSDLEFLRCISVQHWTNPPTMISYLPQTPAPSNQFATLRCIVNGPVGDVTECFFDARNRPVKMQELTGRATPGVRVTATLNRPAGKVRPGDPDAYETRWSWNNDSLCTREVGPGGQQVQCVYESDFDPTTRARKRADCRVVREIASSPVDLDGDGVVDVMERAWRYTYDPRFGSGVTKDWSNTSEWYKWRKAVLDGKVDRRSISVIFHNDAGEEAGRHAINTKGTGTAGRGRGIVLSKPGSTGIADAVTFGRDKLKGLTGTKGDFNLSNRSGGFVRGIDFDCDFVTSATDPRGNVMAAEYDATGNTTAKKEIRKTITIYLKQSNFAYDPYGQLTAITNAPDANGRRSVDTFTYSQGQVVQCVADAGAGGLALTENYEYDVRGNLTRCIDPLGNDWLYTYNALDQLVQAKSAPLSNGGAGTFRIRTQFTYDANDNLTLLAEENLDAAGTPGTNPFWRTQFIYDGAQRMTACWRDKNGALVLRCNQVAYNAADQVVLYRSPEAVNGNDPLNTVAFAYDERGLPYRTIAAPGSPLQSSSQFDYDANGLVTRVSEGLEGTPSVTTMEYDGFAGFGGSSPQIAGKTKGACVCSAAISGSSSLQTASGIRMLTAQRELTEKLRLSKITDPMGNVTTCNYDANANLKVIRHFGQTNDVPGTNGNVRLAESRYDYDGLNRCSRSHELFFSPPTQMPIGDGERTTTFAYAPNDQCTGVTDDLGRVTIFAYDTASRLSSVSSPGGKSVHAIFRDAAGNVTQATQTDMPDLGGPPQVFAWTNVYDSLNRRVTITDNVGNSNSFAYDSRDNCVRSTDPNGNVTTYAYDGLSRPVSSTSYQGATTTIVSSSQFAFDDNDRCVSSTDANGNVTLHAYDSLDRLTQTTYPDSTHHTLVWSPRSNLISETDANGTVINRTYDLNDRCISNNITPGAGVAATTTFETFAYDGASRLVNANNDGSQNAFEYDSLGSCTRGVSGGLGAVVTPHDSVGNRLSMTYPGGRVLTYAYDALDQCTNIVESSASLASFSYAGPDRVARVIYGNGTFSDVTYDGLVGTPNAPGDFGHGQISSITHRAASGSPRLIAVNLSCDPNGNKTLRSDTIFAPAIPRTNDLGLQYDAANRLTRASVISGTTLLRDTVYGLDLMGNRTNVSGATSCSGSYTMSSTIPPADAQMNQYTATPCDTRTYDENGNLTGRSSPATGPTSYQHDYAGRLVQVQAIDFSTGVPVITTATYAYDALGRRISKTVSSGGLPPVTTQYVYDVVEYKDGEDGVSHTRPGNHKPGKGRLIEERVNGLVTASFVLDATRSQDDGVIQMRRGGQDYYFHTDDQGNALALTTTGGTVVERYDYDDYGKVTFLTSDGIPTSATSSSVGNPYCWQGLRLDTETGLHNNDSGGYFEPQTGRWTRRGYTSTARSDTCLSGDRSNPWSGGPAGRSKQSEAKSNAKAMFTAQKAFYAEKDRGMPGSGGGPIEMKNGTVKFFNEAKGFGMVIGGGSKTHTKTGHVTLMK